MAKVMVFVDGTWLYKCLEGLARTQKPVGSVPQPTYGELFELLIQKLRKEVDVDLDHVRTYFFASCPTNCDPLDKSEEEKRRGFFTDLRIKYQIETEIYAIDFKTRRLRRQDRSPTDTFEPKEKCVDVALATSMV